MCSGALAQTSGLALISHPSGFPVVLHILSSVAWRDGILYVKEKHMRFLEDRDHHIMK